VLHAEAVVARPAVAPTADSITSSAVRFAWSPIACTFTWKPGRVRARVTSRSRAAGVTRSPRFGASSLYGARRAAPREPSAPSA
jgi:hypothetical protein